MRRSALESQLAALGYAARLCPMQPEGGISCCGTLGISRLTSETRCGVYRKVGSGGGGGGLPETPLS